MCDSHKFDKRTRRIVLPYTFFLHDTTKAYRLDIFGKRIWLPKSQTVLNHKYRYLTIPLWLACIHKFCEEIRSSGTKKGVWNPNEIVQWRHLYPPFKLRQPAK